MMSFFFPVPAAIKNKKIELGLNLLNLGSKEVRTGKMFAFISFK